MGAPSSLPDLLIAAGELPGGRTRHRPRRPRRSCRPGDMPARIAAACRGHGPARADDAAGARPLHPRQPGGRLRDERSATPTRLSGRDRRGRPPGRRRGPQRAAVPADRRRLRAPGRRRPGRGDRARQRARPGARARADRGRPRALRALVLATQDVRRFEPRARATSGVGLTRCAIALFITCFNDALFPEVGQAVVRLLRRLGHEVEFPAEQTCCGQMHFNSGYQDACIPLVERFAAALRGLRRRRHPVAARVPRWSATTTRVVAASGAATRGATPACRTGSPTVAPRVLELTEFLVDVLGADRRRGPLPAHRRVPPDLPLDPAARRRRSARRGCSPPSTA